MSDLVHAIQPHHPQRDALLNVMIDNRGSDFYYTVGTYPGIKISGEIVMIDDGIEIITPYDAEMFAKGLITHEQHEALLKTKNLDFSFQFQSSRFR